MKKDNSCVYCLCNECYRKKDNSNGKRKRKHFYTDTCDHENLGPYTDCTYFSPTYLQRNLTKKTNTPSECSNCLKQLTSVKQFAPL